MAISKARAEALQEINKLLEAKRSELVYRINDCRRTLKSTASQLTVYKRMRAELSKQIALIESGLKVELEVKKHE